MQKELQKAYFAAGCFWGPEDKFSALDGVFETRVGYSGGEVENPTYELVCGGNTGHAETVEVFFDPDIISYEALLNFFFEIHNPTTLNRQGADIGTQYRSIIFYQNETEKATAERVKAELDASGKFSDGIVTEIVPLENFYPAEEYHQKYKAKMRNAV